MKTGPESGRLRPGAGGRRGFSLLEMLVVLVLIGLMAGLAFPALGHLSDSLKFRQQTHRLAAIVRYARLLAISRNRTVHLRLDRQTDQAVFLISGPSEEQRDFPLGPKDILVMDPGDWYFFPEGTATPGTMTFRRGNQVAGLRLDILTGQPELTRE